MTMITPSYLGETIEYSSLHACRSTLEDPTGVQPLAGSFALDGDTVVFTPRFPFLDGTTYALIVQTPHQLPDRTAPEVWGLARPERSEVRITEVTGIYPSTGEVPVNLLKLYLHFSARMSERFAADAVHLWRSVDRVPLPDVFLAGGTELWDGAHRRLTMLLDPGRIKRGLVPNAESGYPLVEGDAITVVVDASFRDATGTPLRAGFERRYLVGPQLRRRIDPFCWLVVVPGAGTRDPLNVTFDRPLDHALLQHSLAVRDADGLPIAGEGRSGPEERSWKFTPESRWRSGEHRLMVDPRLEDLAGNSPVRVFDRDLTRPEDDPMPSATLVVTFRVL